MGRYHRHPKMETACDGDRYREVVNPTKGYGFIQPHGGGKDVFVHISAVERAGLSTLNEGQQIEYEEVANKGKTSAENLKVEVNRCRAPRASRRGLDRDGPDRSLGSLTPFPATPAAFRD